MRNQWLVTKQVKVKEEAEQDAVKKLAQTSERVSCIRPSPRLSPERPSSRQPAAKTMQRSPTLALNTRALGRMAKFSQVRFNSSDTSSKPPTEEENPAPARKAIPRVSDLGGISLGMLIDAVCAYSAH